MVKFEGGEKFGYFHDLSFREAPPRGAEAPQSAGRSAGLASFVKKITNDKLVKIPTTFTTLDFHHFQKCVFGIRSSLKQKVLHESGIAV